jgi:uncharacterized integral membrane protein
MGIGTIVSNPEAQIETVNEPPTDGGVASTNGSDAATTGPAAERGRGHGRGAGAANANGARHTRISGAWVAVGVAVVLGAALVDFIVQNTRSVRIEFFGADGHIPVAVALLVAALAGAFLVLAVGIARTTQLRLANRRGKKLQKRTESLVADSHS